MLGELSVNIAAKILLDKNTYHLLKNVTLPTETGTTQIDHIIVSKYGIFVIETKNMKGWIFGGEYDKTWTQIIFRKKTKFQNPLHQNHLHTATLEKLFEIDPGKIFPLIVFVGDSKFKTSMPDHVTYCKGYIRYIKSKTDLLLSETEVNTVLAKIKEKRLDASFQTHRDHVAYVKSLHSVNEEPAGWFGGLIVSSVWGLLSLGIVAKKIVKFCLFIVVIVFIGSQLSLNRKSENAFSVRPHATNQTVNIVPKNRSLNLKSPGSIEDKKQNLSTIGTKQELKEPQYRYLIELQSGKSFQADTGFERGGVVTFTDKNGLAMSISRSEIKSITKIQMKE